MSASLHFRQILSEGIKSAAARQGLSIGHFEQNLAEAIGYSQASVHRWRKGHIPDDEPLEAIARYLVQTGGLDRAWLDRFLVAADYEPKAYLLEKILPVPAIAAPALNRADQGETGLKEDWLEAPDVSAFYGRESELAELTHWLVTDRCRVVALLGMGGIGKTALAAKLARQIRSEFEYAIWRSLRNGPPVEQILGDCIKFLSAQQQTDLPEDVDSRISLLVKYLRQARCLLVLDNAETILQEGERAGAYRDGYEGYGQLLQRVGETAHQSCLLLTSREKPRELARLESQMGPVRSRRLAGVGYAAGQEILKDKGVFGAEAVWTALIERCDGNPLILSLISATTQSVFGGDLAAFLAENMTVFGDVRQLLDQQFKRLSPLEQDLMFWLAIEREPVSLQTLRDDLVRPASIAELVEALDSLQRRSLIERSPAGFTLQNVVMEYVIERLVSQVCHEVATEAISIFLSHALIKAQSKDYVRESQIRLILKPVANGLRAVFGEGGVEGKLMRILSTLREAQPGRPGYAGGNTINMLGHLGHDLRGYDFSDLAVWQAYLQGVNLPEVNFAHADVAKSVFTETFGIVASIVVSPNGTLLAAGNGNGEIRWWQIPDGKQLLTREDHTGWVHSVVFNPNGSLLASGGDDQTVRLWEVSSGLCLKTLQGHTNRVWSVVFNPNGSLLASGSGDQTVRLWEVSSGQCLKTLHGHTGWVRSVVFSPDGSLLASGGGDDQTVRLWEVSSGQCLKTLQGHTSRVNSVVFSPDGSLLASGSGDHTVRLWEVSSGLCLKTLQGHINWVRSIVFSPDGSLLASGSEDQTVRLWEVSSGQCLKTLQGHTNRVRSIVFNPNGSLLASGGDDQTVRLWDAYASSGLCLKTLQGHTNRVWSVAFSPNGSLLASGSGDQTVRLWEVSSGQCLKTLQGHTNRVNSVVFNPNGSLLASGGDDQTVRLWEVSSGLCLKTLQGHTSWVWSVAFSPDGSLLASGSGDQTVRLWEVSSGQCLKTLQGHTGWVSSVVFSPDGSLLASGGGDETIRLWDVQIGEYFRTLRPDRPYERMNITGVTGLTEAQKASLRALGAVEDGIAEGVGRH